MYILFYVLKRFNIFHDTLNFKIVDVINIDN